MPSIIHVDMDCFFAAVEVKDDTDFGGVSGIRYRYSVVSVEQVPWGTSIARGKSILTERRFPLPLSLILTGNVSN